MGAKFDPTDATIASRGLPVMSFGEDDRGEIYFLTTTVTGQGIYWLTK
jgi:hypothetical protein